MSERKDSDRQEATAEARTQRKPYIKPAVRCERVFETSALRCGKIHSTQGSCRFNRRTS